MTQQPPPQPTPGQEQYLADLDTLESRTEKGCFFADMGELSAKRKEKRGMAAFAIPPCFSAVE